MSCCWIFSLIYALSPTTNVLPIKFLSLSLSILFLINLYQPINSYISTYLLQLTYLSLFFVHFHPNVINCPKPKLQFFVHFSGLLTTVHNGQNIFSVVNVYFGIKMTSSFLNIGFLVYNQNVDCHLLVQTTNDTLTSKQRFVVSVNC